MTASGSSGHIDEGDCNGNAVEGATVHFHIGDALADESVDVDGAATNRSSP